MIATAFGSVAMGGQVAISNVRFPYTKRSASLTAMENIFTKKTTPFTPKEVYSKKTSPYS
jgi:hypothetical protein